MLYQSPNYKPELITNRYLYISLNSDKPVVEETVKTRHTSYTYRQYELPETEYTRYSNAIAEARKRKMLFPFEVELEANNDERA